MDTEIFEIPELRKPEFEKRFNRLVKLAAKCGSAVPNFTVTGEVMRAYYWAEDDSGRYRVRVQPNKGETLAQAFDRIEAKGNQPRYYTFLTIEVAGPRPQIAGWKFLAKLEHTEQGTMIQKLSDEPVPVKYRETAVPVCDHCQLDRRRRDTYVVKHENGDVRQVGRSCLKDFMGHQTPEHIAAMCSYLEDLANITAGEDLDLLGDDTGRVTNYSLKGILAMSACLIRTTGGYVSRAKAEESYPPRASTASLIYCALGSKFDDAKIKTEQVDWDLAEKVSEWGAALEADETNDYLWNLSVIGRLGIVAWKRVGLAASMVVAYNRAMDLIEEKKHEPKKPSEWFGQPKQKIASELVKVLSAKEFDTRFGSSLRYTFLTEEGNIATWFTGSGFGVQDGGRVIDRGDKLRISFTVKGHDSYFSDSKNETVYTTEILRVKLLELVEDKATETQAHAA